MQLIDNRTQCKCHYGCNIYTGKLAKYIGDGKTYCVEHGRVKSLYNGFRVWLGQQLRDKNKYIYGTIQDRKGVVRLNNKNGDIEFVLWKAGEQGHRFDCWYRMGDGWKQRFIVGYPLELEKTNRLEF